MSVTNDLQVPVDFERLHEFRMLVTRLREKFNGREITKQPGESSPLLIEAFAVFIFMRFWSELAYHARSTNRPGYLTSQGRELFEASLQSLFGEDCSPAQLLVDSGWLEQVPGADAELYCVRFAQTNPHFAGDYVKKELRGNAASILTRTKNQIAHEAMTQTFLLSELVYKKRNGEVMNSTELQRAMVVIKTLDNCLKSQSRKKEHYTEGLIADAFEIVVAYEKMPETLRDIYVWIMTRREKGSPALPTTTEAILRDFPALAKIAVM